MIIAGSTLRITIVINEDIGASGTAVIKYKNLTAEGTWTATVEDSGKGRVFFVVPAGFMSVNGEWKVWGVYTFEDGRLLNTPAKQFTVYAEGTVDR